MGEANAPATKADLNQLDSKFERKIDQLDAKFERKFNQLDEKIELLRSEMNHTYRDLVERLTDAETRLLKAFYDFAEGSQKRMTTLEVSEAATVSRLSIIEDRLLRVERRLNLPPAA